MRIYSQLLREKYRAKLSEYEDEIVAYISDSANRMHQLIESLAYYSTVTREKKVADINTADVLKKALEYLRLAIEETGAEIVAGPLPTIKASQSQLVHVFQNFISNA